jgi:hypothetical protein
MVTIGALRKAMACMPTACILARLEPIITIDLYRTDARSIPCGKEVKKSTDYIYAFAINVLTKKKPLNTELFNGFFITPITGNFVIPVV